MLYDGKCVYWLGIERVVTVDKVDVWLIEVVSDHDYQPTGLIYISDTITGKGHRKEKQCKIRS